MHDIPPELGKNLPGAQQVALLHWQSLGSVVALFFVVLPLPSPIFTWSSKNLHNGKINQKKLYTKIKSKNEILKIKYKNILIGDILYDTYLKSKNEPTIDINSDKFKKYLVSNNVDKKLTDDIISKLTSLNDTIAKDEKYLGSGYKIGHSYFCPDDETESPDNDWYKRIIKFERGNT